MSKVLAFIRDAVTAIEYDLIAIGVTIAMTATLLTTGSNFF